LAKKPRVTGKELVRTLRAMDFAVIRVKGSHHFLRHPDGRCTVVPVHAGEMLGIGLLTKILRDADISAHDLRG
jgi:predicted RNA binding protein YcfA (HicA-like mRNA interferase family)